MRAGKTPLFYAPRCFVMVALVWLVGCGGGGDGMERVDVSGTVTYQGQPVQEGSITFDPQGGGPVAGAQITGGKYQATGRGAVPVGNYIVRISATVEDRENWVEDAMPYPPTKELLPRKYNHESDLQREIPSGARNLEMNFELD